MKTKIILSIIITCVLSGQIFSQEKYPSQEVWETLEDNIKADKIDSLESIKEKYNIYLLQETWEFLEEFSEEERLNTDNLKVIKLINDEKVKQMLPEIKLEKNVIGRFKYIPGNITVYEEAYPEKVYIELKDNKIFKIEAFLENFTETYNANNIDLSFESLNSAKLYPEKNETKCFKLTDLIDIDSIPQKPNSKNTIGFSKHQDIEDTAFVLDEKSTMIKINNFSFRLLNVMEKKMNINKERKKIRIESKISRKDKDRFKEMRKKNRYYKKIYKEELCMNPILIKDEVEIDSVNIYIEEGTVWRVLVYNKNEYFENITGFIPLWYFHNQRQKKLFSSKRPKINTKKKWVRNKLQDPKYNPKRYMYLGDAISYIPSSTRFSFPKDTTLSLTKKQTIVKLSNRDNLYSFLSVRTFTDILALTDNAENGLVQIEGEGKFYINQIPCRNSRFYFGHYVKPYMRLTKFGNEEDYLLIGDTIETYASEIFAKSKLAFGIDLNIAEWLLEYGSFNLDFGIRFDHSTVKDDPELALKGKADLFTYYFKVGGTVIESKNFGLEGSFSHYWQNVLDNYGSGLNKQYKSPDNANYLVPEFLLYVGNKTSLGTLFLKVSHYYSYNKSEKSFTHLQFGYNIRLKLPTKKY